MKQLDKVIGQWRQQWMSDNLSSDIRVLINQAGIDLYCGADSLDNYPGFTSACKLIREALDATLPSELWFDINGGWTENDPAEWNDYDSSDWYYYNRTALRKIIVGKELDLYL